MISAHKNHYQNLGLSPSATQDEIKKAYRKLAMKYHPDHNPKRRSAEERFKLLQRAYETLSDPESRAQYNLRLSEVRQSSTERDEGEAADWRLSRLEPYVLPFLIGAVVGSLCGFKALVEVYTPALDSWVWGVFFIGGGALVGGVGASVYFTRENLN
jgi:curved DNA-binding protein CbpA